MNKPCIFILHILFSASLSAQTDSISYDQANPVVVSSDWKERGLTLGVGLPTYIYGEIGHYRSYVFEAGGFPVMSSMMNYGVEFSKFDRWVVAPKIQGRIHYYFFNASLTAICYTSFNNDYAIKLRPEIGIGLWNFDINYGYNIGVLKHDFERTNRHFISLRVYLKIKEKPFGAYDRNGNIVN